MKIREAEEEEETVAAHYMDEGTEESGSGVPVVDFKAWLGIDEVEGDEEAGSAQGTVRG
jgi:hypothetical protein